MSAELKVRQTMIEVSRFDARPDLVPMDPGVYLMKDSSGSVIYIGKAINLRNRLRSYFTALPKGNAKVLAMISHIADFSYIICVNELEALILECNLIKEYLPRYNILLRDDKEYPYIRVTLDEKYPRVLKAFRIGSDIKNGAKYYGPYPGGNLKIALETLRTIFPMKTCNRVLPKDVGKDRPCLNFYIGKCSGPCRGDVSIDEYRKGIGNIRMFLEGRYDSVIKSLEHDMKAAAESFDYEKAAIWRDRLQSLKRIMEKQTVSAPAKGEFDVIGFHGNGNEICIQKLEIRNGRLIGNATFFVPEDGSSREEILEIILLQHYLEAPSIPNEILLPFETEENAAFEAALATLRKMKVTVRVPVRGYGKELLTMANNNAVQALRRHILLVGNSRIATLETLNKLSELITGESGKLSRIEAFDISNISQDDISASMVVFIDGKPARSQYRLFKIRGQESQDDYSSMRQAISRRLDNLEASGFGGVPDLILVDGGKGHITVAQEALGDADRQITVLGMVKDSRHHTRGLLFTDGRQIGLDPQIQSPDMEREETLGILRLISAIQEEAHRFAIQYTQKLSKKRNLKFTLEGISGIGPKRRKDLLLAFHTLRAIGLASLEDVRNVKGMTEKAAQSVYNHFHGEEGETQ